jgi:hypothetical protein
VARSRARCPTFPKWARRHPKACSSVGPRSTRGYVRRRTIALSPYRASWLAARFVREHPPQMLAAPRPPEYAGLIAQATIIADRLALARWPRCHVLDGDVGEIAPRDQPLHISTTRWRNMLLRPVSARLGCRVSCAKAALVLLTLARPSPKGQGSRPRVSGAAVRPMLKNFVSIVSPARGAGHRQAGEETIIQHSCRPA